ncbi:hypothetical protein PF011_g19397 [Phytophthora fragariae]|uniref:FLYWCH-type domain-containing protein n=1 Tax=Phytophthora fragariae TaxID=53985 RepID=A0A6A3J0N4_9STRA|nr:hypothetical protein PF011_g19397 [Phytophthora fragariae]
MHAVPIAADSSTAGEFDQQWEFGFNSDINAASASEASSDSDDSDAGYVSSVYGDREPSSDSKSEDSGVINEAFGRNTSPVFVGANVDEARNDDDSGLSSSMSSAGGSGDSESEVSIDEDADAEDGEDEGFEDVSALHGTVIQIKGYQYTKVRQSSRKILFRCSFYRRTSGCKGKVEFCLLREAFINFAPHTCGGGDRAPCRHVDVMDDMKAEVDRLAISNLSQTPLQIWRLVRDSFFERDDDAVVQGLTRQQVTQRVYRTRRLHFGGNVHGMFEVAPQSHVSGTTLNFFPFHQTIMEGDRLQRIIGWVDPRLLELLRYPGAQMFVDGTFRCVPRSFYQCVVLMVSDAASGVFVPCVYALATGKSNLLYRKMMTFGRQE